MHQGTPRKVVIASDGRVNSLPPLQRLGEYYKTTMCIHDTIRRMNKELAEITEESTLLESSKSSTKINDFFFSRKIGNHAKNGLGTHQIVLQNGRGASVCDKKKATEKYSGYSVLISSGSTISSVHDVVPTTGEFIRESEEVKGAEEKGIERVSSFADRRKATRTGSSMQNSTTTDGTLCSTNDLDSYGTEESVFTAAPEDENKLFAEDAYLSHDEKVKSITRKLALLPERKKKKKFPYRYHTKEGANRRSVDSSRGTRGSRNSSVFSASSQERSGVVNLPLQFKKLLRRVNRCVDRELGERKDSSLSLSNSSRSVKLDRKKSPDRLSQSVDHLPSATSLH